MTTIEEMKQAISLIYLYKVLPLKYDINPGRIVVWIDDNVPILDIDIIDEVIRACEKWCKSVDDKQYESEADNG